MSSGQAYWAEVACEMLPCEGCICDLANILPSETKKEDATSWPAAYHSSKSVTAASSTSENTTYLSCQHTPPPGGYY